MDNDLLQNPENVQHLLNCVRHRRKQLQESMWNNNSLVERELLDQINKENGELIDIEVALEILADEMQVPF